MGETVPLTAGDGFRFTAYRAQPRSRPRGGIVIVQEIFGVNRHIRAVTDQYAGHGYLAVAPGMFDRVQAGVDVPYTDFPKGREYATALKLEQTLLDLQAAVKSASEGGRVGVVGYCWGGTIAYLAACECPIAAAVAYYGGRITQYLDRKPRCPLMYHFGELDKAIPMTTVAQIRAAHREGIFYTYPAGHGFNCTDRAEYEPESARLALERTLKFLEEHVG